MSLTLHFAADSHKGMIREGNEDSGYAGPRLLAVADGMGGQAAGEVASSEVLSLMYPLDEDIPGTDLLGSLGSAVEQANDRLRDMVEEDPQLEGMGCTLTAMLFTGQRVGLVHVGDSRAYLLRDGQLTQITTDHKWVQRLVDEGRITEEEAASHPQRSLLMRALDGRGQAEPDLTLREFRAGDRYLLCSDGLSDVVSLETLQETLSGYQPPHDTVQELIQLALRAGGPDNITVIVADVLEAEAGDTFAGHMSDRPLVVGAVADGPPTMALPPQQATSPASRAAELGRPTSSGGPPDPDGTTGFGPAEYTLDDNPVLTDPASAGSSAPTAGQDIAAGYAKKRPHPWRRRSLLILLVLVVLGGLAYGGWRWTQTQYFVGTKKNNVAIYRGLNQTFLGLDLSSLQHRYSSTKVQDLPPYSRTTVRDTIGMDNLKQARAKVRKLEHQAEVCRSVRAAEKRKDNDKSHRHGSGDQTSGTVDDGALGTSGGKGKDRASKRDKGASPSPTARSTRSPEDAQLAKECLTDNQP